MAGKEILEVYIWVLSGVLGFLITVLILGGATIANSIGKKIDNLVESVKELSVLTASQNEQIKTLFNTDVETARRLNDHGERLRDIEIQCGKCTT